MVGFVYDEDFKGGGGGFDIRGGEEFGELVGCVDEKVWW